MGAGGKSAGPPPAVKKVLSLFGSGREEDKMVGYLSFLKVGPKLLKFLPGEECLFLGGVGAWSPGAYQRGWFLAARNSFIAGALPRLSCVDAAGWD